MLGRMCLHLSHSCITIVENISKLDWEAGGDLRVHRTIQFFLHDVVIQ